MSDPTRGPEVTTEASQEHRADRIRDLAVSIQHAAIGHAAALYEIRRDEILKLFPPKEGFGVRVQRRVERKCPLCRGSGIKYEVITKSQRSAITVHYADPWGPPPEPPPLTTEPMITIKECRCVQYEAVYVKAPEATETAIVVPPEQVR